MRQFVGQTIVAVDGLAPGSNRLVFTFEGGKQGVFYHAQDCCETVEIAEGHGEATDLIGQPLLHFEGAESQEPRPHDYADSFTWTFYHFRTSKGTVTVRWLGESNGYYSESVDFMEA